MALVDGIELPCDERRQYFIWRYASTLQTYSQGFHLYIPNHKRPYAGRIAIDDGVIRDLDTLRIPTPGIARLVIAQCDGSRGQHGFDRHVGSGTSMYARLHPEGWGAEGARRKGGRGGAMRCVMRIGVVKRIIVTPQ
ncbi:hypothetical protein S40293_10636 [Stachybotrys chartarum IBT 40293]|nr:hypothetical protein S40293_10636 [Stachybotrys chartarum IBT 40293]KFA72332.1 hypothetical protein S40288_10717 [Stachybotrys chartarum IBT 40288]